LAWLVVAVHAKEGFIRRAKHRVTAALRDRNYKAMHDVSQKRYSAEGRGHVWMALGLGVEVRQCACEARNTEILVVGREMPRCDEKCAFGLN
jgi:hypothetical protein